jgi:hypothetical protein
VTKGLNQPLAGTELVLVAQVPKAGSRWTQVHFNLDLTKQFFRLEEGDERTLTFERIDDQGHRQDRVARPLVLSGINRNSKIELDFGMKEGKRPDYPEDGGPPIVVILELDTRTFRYQTLMPGQQGHDVMHMLTKQLPSVGRGLPRVLTTLDEVELRWPNCNLRSPL